MAEEREPGPRSREAQARTRVRIAVCFEMLMRGHTAFDIYRIAAEVRRKHEAGETVPKADQRFETWKVSQRQVRWYCQQARKKLEQVTALKAEQAFGLSMLRREAVYHLAMTNKDPGSALRAQDSIDKLNGLQSIVGGGGDADTPRGIKLPDGTIVEI